MAVLRNEHQNLKKMLTKQIGKEKAIKAAQKSLSLAKSMLRGKTTSLYTVCMLKKNKSLNLFKIYL
jgi:hypothetical protein